jgi:hypothetical protein
VTSANHSTAVFFAALNYISALYSHPLLFILRLKESRVCRELRDFLSKEVVTQMA